MWVESVRKCCPISADLEFCTGALETQSDFSLYLAVPQGTYKSNFQHKLAQTVVKRNQIKLLVFEEENEEIVLWTN